MEINIDVQAGLELGTFRSRERFLNRSATAPQVMSGMAPPLKYWSNNKIRHEKFKLFLIYDIVQGYIVGKYCVFQTDKPTKNHS